MKFAAYSFKAGTVEEIRSYAESLTLPFEIEWADSSAADRYGIVTVPTTLVLRGNRVLTRLFNGREPEVWRRVLDDAIAAH